jgi:hypothetical protein
MTIEKTICKNFFRSLIFISCFSFYRLTAYSRLSTNLLQEMSLSIVLHPDKEKLNELQKNIFSLSNEFNRDKSSLNETMAKKDQVIYNLQAEKAILE